MHNSPSYALASHGQESKMTISYCLPSLKVMCLFINQVGDSSDALALLKGLLLSFKGSKYLM